MAQTVLEDKILQAGEEVFRERGYAQADMRTIAKKAGIAVGTIYNYFPNKNHLFHRIIERSWHKLEIQCRGLVSRSQLNFREKLRLFAHCHWEFFQTHRVLWLEVAEGQGTKEGRGWTEEYHQNRGGYHLKEIYQRYVDYLEQMVEDGVRRGDLPPVPTRPYAIAFLAGLNGIARNFSHFQTVDVDFLVNLFSPQAGKENDIE